MLLRFRTLVNRWISFAPNAKDKSLSCFMVIRESMICKPGEIRCGDNDKKYCGGRIARKNEKIFVQKFAAVLDNFKSKANWSSTGAFSPTGTLVFATENGKEEAVWVNYYMPFMLVQPKWNKLKDFFNIRRCRFNYGILWRVRIRIRAPIKSFSQLTTRTPGRSNLRYSRPLVSKARSRMKILLQFPMLP